VYRLLSGHVVPNTIEAKRLFFGYDSRPLWFNAITTMVIVCTWLTFMGPAALGLVDAARRQADRVVVLSLALMVAAFSVTGPEVLTHNLYRYLHPLGVPAVIAGVCVMRSRARQVVLAAGLAWSCWSAPEVFAHWRSGQLLMTQAQGRIAASLTERAAPGTVVLIHDAGYLSEYTSMSLVDVVGLKTPRATELYRNAQGASQEAKRAAAVHRLACEASPSYYVATSDWEHVFGLTRALADFGWSPTLLVRHPVVGPARTQAYSLYSLNRPERCSEVAAASRRTDSAHASGEAR
jgi:hypothetical protein